MFLYILCSLTTYLCPPPPPLPAVPIAAPLPTVAPVVAPPVADGEAVTTLTPWAFPWTGAGQDDDGYCPELQGWGWTGSLLWPVEGFTELRPFGRKPGGWHSGIDLIAPDGTPVMAPTAGVVVWRGYTSSGYGLMVAIASGGRVIILGHLSAVADGLECGDGVTAGQVVGYVGRTGAVAGASHLHLEIRHQGLAWNPGLWLAARE